MITRRMTLALLSSVFVPGFARAGFIEPEMLKDDIIAARLPDQVNRLPLNPRVVNLSALGRKPGKYGGTARMIIGGQKDIRLMTIYGYTRLVGYDQKLNLVADVLDHFDEVEDRIFTFHIRKRHRWSDGVYFTSEDFRYYFEDVLSNKELKPGGLPPDLLAGGKPPKFEVLDEYTVRYSWDVPNPEFLPRLAAPQPLVLVLPSHYMRSFHRKYQDDFRLSALMVEQRVDEWTDLHAKMSRTYRPENPELPTLDPWRNTVAPPAEQFVFVRNPYFHRTDENGMQLPYLDKIVLNVSSSSVIAAQTGAGESDLQATGIDFADYTFLKDAEKRYPIKVRLWKRTQGSRLALLPNLNCSDLVWRKVFQDVRVRRALSVAINRHEINMVAFFGLGKESADTVLPESPLFKPEYQSAWAEFNPELANKLLDEAGLDKRDEDGNRLLPDGRVANIVVETAGESTLETDVLELVADHWRNVGMPMFIRSSQRDLLRSRAISGDLKMSIWMGMDNGVPTADMSPSGLVPTRDDQMQWASWGIHYLSKGETGTAPDVPEVKRLVELLGNWQRTTTTEERRAIWDEMLKMYADQVFTIGLVNATLQPIATSADLRNVPDSALFGFDPTSYLGIYMPDTFWYDRGA